MADLATFAKLLDLAVAGDHALVVPADPDPSQEFHSAGMLTAVVTAAAARAFPGQDARSVHVAFLGAASPAQPMRAEFTVLRGGRQLTAAAAAVTQDGRLCAHGYVLLGPQTGEV